MAGWAQKLQLPSSPTPPAHSNGGCSLATLHLLLNSYSCLRPQAIKHPCIPLSPAPPAHSRDNCTPPCTHYQTCTAATGPKPSGALLSTDRPYVDAVIRL
eukprot:1155470-Pelagomonas_calceolata.AAC.8